MDQPKHTDTEDLGHRSWEAFQSGLFETALELIDRHIKREPDDVYAHLAKGKYLTLLEDSEAAAIEFIQYYEMGGNTQTAADHLVRSIAHGRHDEICLDGRLFDADLLGKYCREIFSENLGPFIEQRIAELTAPWNALRADLARRAEHYPRALEVRDASDILLCVPPHIHFQSGYPPYGISVLLNYLGRQGFQCGFADINLALYEALGPDWSRWWSLEGLNYWTDPFEYATGPGMLLRLDMVEIAQALSRVECAVIGFSCMNATRRFTIQLAPLVRRSAPRARLVLGGPDCFFPERCRSRYQSILKHIDAFIVGEGEHPLRDFLRALRDKADWERIPGVLPAARAAASGRLDFQKAPPIPAEDLAGFHRFDPAYIERIPEPRMRLTSSNRGCVNQCDFCYDRIAWQKFRVRDPKDVVDEIEWNHRHYGVRHFHLVDTASNASPRHLGRLCDLLVELALPVEIATSVMVSERMTPELYAKMFRAGFRMLYFGIESGSDSVLCEMGKRGDAGEASRNLRLSSEAGLLNCIFIIVGHPAEGEKEYQETLEFLKDNKPYIYLLHMVNQCQILPYTLLADKVEARGVQVPERWEELAAWKIGDNSLSERIRRKEELVVFARAQGIALCDGDHPQRPATPERPEAGLKGVARKIVAAFHWHRGNKEGRDPGKD